MTSDFRKAVQGAADVSIGARASRLFVGTLDDSVSRYPWDGLQPNAAFLNRLLIDHALFGTPLCARGGNIVYFEPYLQALLGEVPSPLASMIESGFFQIQMQSPSINDAISLRVRERTPSAIAFQARRDWKPGTDVFNRLDALDKRIVEGRGKVSYSPSFRSFAQLLMEEAVSGGSDEFKRVYSEWERLSPEEKTRSNFEDIALRLFPSDTRSVTKAMWVANSVNHFAYGSAMLDYDPTHNIAVETSDLAPLVDACAGYTQVSEERSVEARNRLVRDKVLDKLEGLLAVPKALIADIDTQRQLAALFNEERSSERAVKGFLNSKADVLVAVDSILSDPNSISERELYDRAKRYSDRLAEALGLGTSERVKVRIKLLARSLQSRFEDATVGSLLSEASDAFVPAGLKSAVGFVVSLFQDEAKRVVEDRMKGPFNRFFLGHDVHGSETQGRVDEPSRVVSYGASVSTRIIRSTKVARLKQRMAGRATPSNSTTQTAL